MTFLVSCIYTIFIGFIDAVIKGNVVAFYLDWSQVPWYFKDANFVYPAFISLLLLAGGISLARKYSYNIYWFVAMLIVWGFSGLESLSYWFWIMVLGINQPRAWLPDSSLFGWYPPTAPWLNDLLHLKILSNGGDVTRQAVVLGVLLAIVINLFLLLISKVKSFHNH